MSEIEEAAHNKAARRWLCGSIFKKRTLSTIILCTKLRQAAIRGKPYKPLLYAAIELLWHFYFIHVAFYLAPIANHIFRFPCDQRLPPGEAAVSFSTADFRKGYKNEPGVCFYICTCGRGKCGRTQRVNITKENAAGKKDRTKSYYYQFSRSPYGHAGGGQHQTLFHLHTIYRAVFTTLYEVLMCLSNRSRQKVSVSMSAPMCWCRLLLLSLISKQTTNIWYPVKLVCAFSFNWKSASIRPACKGIKVRRLLFNFDRWLKEKICVGLFASTVFVNSAGERAYTSRLRSALCIIKHIIFSFFEIKLWRGL